jgi:hypothetical protein
MHPCIAVGSETVSGEALWSWRHAETGHGVVGGPARGPAGAYPPLPRGRDQILDADDIANAFAMIDEHGEAHFSSHFLESSGEKISMLHPPFHGAKGMFNTTFPQFGLLRIRQDSLLHVVQKTFMYPSRASTVSLVTGAW